MDTTHLTDLLHSFATTPSRRAVSRALAGLVIGGTVAPVAAKKCKPCRKRRKGKCKGKKPDDTPCEGTGRCLKGKCNPRPDCIAAFAQCDTGNSAACCSEFCIPTLPPVGMCQIGLPGQRCLEDSGCASGECVGYRCSE